MEIMLMPLMAMGFVFILAPFLALVPTGIFIWIYLKSKRLPVLMTGLLWAVYTAYEYAMKLRILCSGECNIRIDLLLIYPLLIVTSIIAVVSTVRWFKNN